MACTGSAHRQPPVWALVVLLWAVATGQAHAQSALTGIVHDPGGRVAVGAIVRVTDLATETLDWEARVSSIGYFEVELTAGFYHVEAFYDQFAFVGTIYVYPEEKTAFDIELYITPDERAVGGTASLHFEPVRRAKPLKRSKAFSCSALVSTCPSLNAHSAP